MDEHAYYRYQAELPTAPAPAVAEIPLAEWLPARTRSYALLGVVAFNDAGRNKYIGAHFLSGNTTFIHVWRLDSGGAVTGEWRLVPPGILKLDGIWLQPGGPAGADIEALGVYHEAVAGERNNGVLWGLIPGGVLVPYPQGRPPTGGGYDTRNLGDGGAPVSGPVDLTPQALSAIQTGVQNAVNGMVALFGSEGIRTAIRNKVWDALVGLMDPANPDARAALYRALLSSFLHDNPGLYARLRETFYEVLVQHGLIPPHAADRAVGPQPLPGLPPELATLLETMRAADYDLPPE